MGGLPCRLEWPKTPVTVTTFSRGWPTSPCVVLTYRAATCRVPQNSQRMRCCWTDVCEVVAQLPQRKLDGSTWLRRIALVPSKGPGGGRRCGADGQMAFPEICARPLSLSVKTRAGGTTLSSAAPPGWQLRGGGTRPTPAPCSAPIALGARHRAGARQRPLYVH
jgi:hypothetical protein